jgi:hypothetical protein
MRFLYGDSAPFPLGYNFLATLEAFMATATRIVQLDHEARALAAKTEEIGQNRIKGLEALEQFHTVVMRAVQDTAHKVQHPHALDYAQRVAEFASSYVEDHRRSLLAANEREASQARVDAEQRVKEQRTLLDSFLKVARLPVLSTKLSMRLQGEGREAKHQITAVFDNPDGIQTAFAIGTSRVQAWAAPRRVADFAQGVDLMVGVDKSWLRGTVTAKQINVDEWIVTQFDLADDAFDVMIRNRKAEKETLFFRLRRTEAGLGGIVEHPGQQAPQTLSPQDLAQLERIWNALRLACRELVDHKEQLLAVNLDGAGVFEGGLVIPFVVRLVQMFAPTVREIAKRSPNEFELSLKMESDGGRREELYLRKEQLTSSLQPLSAAGRQVFAPLGLDTWVPGTTSAPPPVVASGSVPVPSPSTRRPVEG